MPMTSVSPEKKNPAHWSLFARTLEDILGAPQHDETPLSRLDNLRERPGEELNPADPRSPRELVHREKVGRLIRSLQVPGTFPLLSRDDLERIRRYFHLDHEESLQLQAVIIATQVQRIVYERFGANDDLAQRLKAAAAALHAAELVLPTLTEAVRQMALADVKASGDEACESTAPVEMAPPVVGELSGLIAGDVEVFVGTLGSAELREKQLTSGEPLEMTPRKKHRRDSYDERPFIAAALAEALDAIDRGMLALHLSYSAAGSAEQLAEARTARDAFADALNQLDGQSPELKSSEAWKFWEAEARSRQQDAAGLCS